MWGYIVILKNKKLEGEAEKTIIKKISEYYKLRILIQKLDKRNTTKIYQKEYDDVRIYYG